MRPPDPQQRIAVTGAGIICSIGRNKAEVWQAIVDARAGIDRLTRFPGETFPTELAAEVESDLASLLPDGKRALRRLSRTDLLAVIAAKEALDDADANATTPLPRERAIVSTGTSTGGLLEGENYYFHRRSRGRRRAAASHVLQQPTSGPSDAVARAFSLGGGVVSNATACASAGAAIGMAADYLRSRHADVAVAGGSDALCRLTYSGFNVLQAVDPAPCSPFGADRKGITLGEGAGYLVLERWDDAVARGATILAELSGYGASCDAHHQTAPAEDGRGAEAAMRAALAEGRLDTADVDYVNAHGTGTLLNDSAETKAIIAALGMDVPVSSSKSYFGHTLGASGAVEAVVSVLALRNQIAPPTLRLQARADDCPLDYIPHAPRPLAMANVLSNTFGFGGSNVSLLFRRVL
ncbi:MAG: beta-ketoacyl-[acyl-carrier-protein] synthase family protein [Acidobacteria bacterium]|nr:beta-ketoacyl-[acyl-carrier-protein] synthase family protein [Acidobacteriota bacterium]MBV9475161.1 beta-ketoacyl-[acyl-carrier-protein] synthase family protein [Acidobacteriota bacterium]